MPSSRIGRSRRPSPSRKTSSPHGGPEQYAAGVAAAAKEAGHPLDPEHASYLEEQGKRVAQEMQPTVIPGEARKFLGDESKYYATVEGSKDLDAKLEDLKAGKVKTLIMSPELMRDQKDKLLAAGFGKEDSAFFPDEAHELEVGTPRRKRWHSRLRESARRRRRLLKEQAT